MTSLFSLSKHKNCRFTSTRFTPLLPATILLLLVFLTSAPFALAAHPAHTRRSISPRPRASDSRYDRSITTFDPHGRLLQVEYARTACDTRGATVACLLGPARTAAPLSAEDGSASSASWCVVGVRSPGDGPAAVKVHRLDDHAILVTAGLAGDGRALASAVRKKCQSHRTSFGEPPGLDEVAEVIGAMQHASTLASGGRVWGVTATVVGVDGRGGMGMYQTDPGGAVESRVGCVAGMGRQEGEDKLEEHVKKWMMKEDTEEKMTMGEEESAFDCIMEILLGKESEEPGSDIDTPKEQVKAADLYFLRCDPERRGGVFIVCAKHVQMKDAELIKQLFFHDDKR